jgi:hypothetical protein
MYTVSVFFFDFLGPVILTRNMLFSFFPFSFLTIFVCSYSSKWARLKGNKNNNDELEDMWKRTIMTKF